MSTPKRLTSRPKLRLLTRLALLALCLLIALGLVSTVAIPTLRNVRLPVGNYGYDALDVGQPPTFTADRPALFMDFYVENDGNLRFRTPSITTYFPEGGTTCLSALLMREHPIYLPRTPGYGDSWMVTDTQKSMVRNTSIDPVNGTVTVQTRYPITAPCPNVTGPAWNHSLSSSLLGQDVLGDPSTRTILRDVIRPPYFYPFDAYHSNVSFEITGTVTYSSAVPFSGDPILYATITSPIWDVQTDLLFPGEVPNNVVDFTIERPLSTRILTVLLLGTIFFCILLTPIIREIGTTLEVVVAIIFSLWSLNAILIPENITWTTITENSILLLYVLLAFMLFIRFAIIPAWRRLGVAPATATTAAPETPLPSAPVSLMREGRGEGVPPTPTQRPPFPPPAAPTHTQPATQSPVHAKRRTSSIPRLVATSIATIAAIAAMTRMINRSRKP